MYLLYAFCIKSSSLKCQTNAKWMILIIKLDCFSICMCWYIVLTLTDWYKRRKLENQKFPFDNAQSFFYISVSIRLIHCCWFAVCWFFHWISFWKIWFNQFEFTFSFSSPRISNVSLLRPRKAITINFPNFGYGTTITTHPVIVLCYGFWLEINSTFCLFIYKIYTNNKTRLLLFRCFTN